MDREEYLYRLRLIKHQGYTVEFNSDMTYNELVNVYQTIRNKIERENEDKQHRVKMLTILDTLSRSGLITPKRVLEIADSNMTNSDLHNKIVEILKT